MLIIVVVLAMGWFYGGIRTPGKTATPEDTAHILSPEEIIDQLRQKAAQGDMLTQFDLGRMYDEGRGVPQDYQEAAKWYRQAAAQGYAVAQYNLGVMYGKGQGVPQDYQEAMKWYRQAAAQGRAAAQYNLGVMFVNGEGVSKNYVEGYAWIIIALENGMEDANQAKAQIEERLDASQIEAAERRAEEIRSGLKNKR